MRQLIHRRLTGNVGGFVIELNQQTGEICGHLFHSKEQARELFGPKVGAVLEEQPPILTLVERSGWPETSPHAAITVCEEHAALMKSKIENAAVSQHGKYIMLPEGWAVCCFTLPYNTSCKGLIGYLDGQQRAHVCFLHSKAEARRITRLQQSLTPDGLKNSLREIEESTLPETCPRATEELTGPLAMMFNASLAAESGILSAAPLPPAAKA